jgi:hypothetical protein
MVNFGFGLVFEPVKIGFQRQSIPGQHRVVDFLVPPIAQRGGEAIFAREEVLVDTEDPRAAPRMPFGKPALESVLEVSDRRWPRRCLRACPDGCG